MSKFGMIYFIDTKDKSKTRKYSIIHEKGDFFYGIKDFEVTKFSKGYLDNFESITKYYSNPYATDFNGYVYLTPKQNQEKVLDRIFELFNGRKDSIEYKIKKQKEKIQRTKENMERLKRSRKYYLDYLDSIKKSIEIAENNYRKLKEELKAQENKLENLKELQKEEEPNE